MDQDIEQLEKWRNYFQEQLELLNKDLEDAKRQIDEKKKQEPEFDFRKLMPVGSTWLGSEYLEVEGEFLCGRSLPLFKNINNAEKAHIEIYYAHQIVKEAQALLKEYEPCLLRLSYWLNEAEKAGVLQNLE